VSAITALTGEGIITGTLFTPCLVLTGYPDIVAYFMGLVTVFTVKSVALIATLTPILICAVYIGTTILIIVLFTPLAEECTYDACGSVAWHTSSSKYQIVTVAF
jgi:hypothetical protein